MTRCYCQGRSLTGRKNDHSRSPAKSTQNIQSKPAESSTIRNISIFYLHSNINQNFFLRNISRFFFYINFFEKSVILNSSIIIFSTVRQQLLLVTFFFAFNFIFFYRFFSRICLSVIFTGVFMLECGKLIDGTLVFFKNLAPAG